jgi:aspartate/tyrosine/aromatic aminotransferase
MSAASLTFDQARKMLPRRKKIGTRLGIFGADWDRTGVLEAMEAAEKIMETAGMAKAMGYGLAITYPRSQSGVLFIETKRPKP